MKKPTSKKQQKRILKKDTSISECKAFAESEVFEAVWNKSLEEYKTKNPQNSEHPHIFHHNLSSLTAIEDFKQLLIENLLLEKESEQEDDEDPSFSD